MRVRITDHGGGDPLPERVTPDIDAKLAGEQTPRGWGRMLIEKLVDETHVTTNGELRTLELVMRDA